MPRVPHIPPATTPAPALPSTGSYPAQEASAPRRLGTLLVTATAGAPSLQPGQRIVTFDRALFIGRAAPEAEEPGVWTWLVPDPLVSARHARIDRAGEGGYVLSDLGSRNGTRVDGVPVTGPTVLRPGAVLFLGTHVAVFRELSEDELSLVRREQVVPFGPVPLLSPVSARIGDRLRRLAAGHGELLLVGETGVGKEVFARAVHRASGRTGRFVPVNCAALPRELIESVLFGYVRGAHSEARESKTGLVETAEGGTLFLDEIGEMSSELQAKLLRFVQDRQVWPVGATSGRTVDVRIIAATNRVGGGDRAAGLRPDLAARLGAEPVVLPALRDRPEDIGVLAAHFLGGRRTVEPRALQALALHRWPGNVRELGKALAEAEVLSADRPAIDLEHLPQAVVSPPADLDPGPGTGARVPAPPRPAPSAPELEALLRLHGGNVLRVARALDRKPALIYRWLERYGIELERFRG